MTKHMIATELRLDAIKSFLLDNDVIRLFETRETMTEEGSFSPVVMQTGAGKTYNAIRWIALRACRQVLDPVSWTRKSVYLTPNRHNVQAEYDGFKACILGLSERELITDDERNEILSASLLLPSKAESFGLFVRRHNGFDTFMAEIKENFPRFGDTSDNERLKFRFLDAAARLQMEASATTLPSFARAELVEACTRSMGLLRLDFTNTLAELYGEIRAAAGSVRQRKWIRKHLPDLLFAEGLWNTSFMSVSKAMYPMTGFNGSTSDVFRTGRNCLVIDEFDASKNFIQDALFKQDTNGVDLAELVTMFTGLSQRQKRCNYPGNEVLQKAMSDLFEACENARDEYNIDGNLRPSEEAKEQMNASSLLFSGDRQTFYTSSSSVNVGYSLDDEGILLNLLDKTDTDSEDLVDTGLAALIFGIENLVDFKIVKLLDRIQYEFSKEIAKETDGAVQPDVRQSLRLFMNSIGRDTTQNGTVKDEVVRFIEARIARRRQEGRSDIMVATPYDNGVKIDKIAQPPGALGSPSWQMLVSSADQTAENVIEDAASRHVVVGISATAKAKTVIRNFDIDHLERRLGDRFIDMSQDEIAGVSEIYRSERNYQKAIDDGRLNIDASTPFVSPRIRRLINECKFLKLRDRLEFLSYLESNPYEVRRLCNFAAAIDAYLCDARNVNKQTDHVAPGLMMLCFLSRRADTNYQATSIRIDMVLCGIIAKIGASHGKKPFVQAAYANNLRDRDLDTIVPSSAEPVILLTTHDSMASGFNPQRRKCAEDHVAVMIGTVDRGDDRIDIDGLYVEKPTQIFQKSLSTNGDKLRATQSSVALAYTGAIPRSTSHKIRKCILAAEANCRKDLNDVSTMYMQSTDYKNAVRSIVEQILGRITRTPWRRPFIKIMFPDDLAEILRTDRFEGCPVELKSYEYRFLCNELQNRTNGHVIPTEVPKVMLNRNMEVMVRNSSSIRFLKKDLSINLKKQSRWEMLREVVLTLPGKSTAGKYSDICMRFQQPRTSYNIWHDRDMTAEGCKFSFEPKAAWSCFEVSSRGTKLDVMMKNPVIKNWFDERGYATRFVQSKEIMSPMLAQAIYMGALGEEAIKAILFSLDLEVRGLDAEHFEYFDMLAGQSGIPIDAKHYNTYTAAIVDMESLAKKSASKLEEMNRECCLIVQVIDDVAHSQSDITWVAVDGKRIGFLSGLIDGDGVLKAHNASALSRFLRGHES